MPRSRCGDTDSGEEGPGDGDGARKHRSGSPAAGSASIARAAIGAAAIFLRSRGGYAHVRDARGGIWHGLEVRSRAEADVLRTGRQRPDDRRGTRHRWRRRDLEGKVWLREGPAITRDRGDWHIVAVRGWEDRPEKPGGQRLEMGPPRRGTGQGGGSGRQRLGGDGRSSRRSGRRSAAQSTAAAAGAAPAEGAEQGSLAVKATQKIIELFFFFVGDEKTSKKEKGQLVFIFQFQRLGAGCRGGCQGRGHHR
mmetsp:Transcript_24151/g.67211  ORF Transcript_24151/g.67211 Transcript_24151/m.67211 type:complete len:251 (-) Transcript_24151:44-796(-)